MSIVNLVLGVKSERIEQVVGLHTETFPAGHFDVATLPVIRRELVPQLSGGLRREGHHFVGEVRVVVGSFMVAKAAQSFDHGVLCFRLPGIDDVVNLGHIAEVGMIILAVVRRNPAVMAVPIAKEFSIAKVATQQPELPHVIGDVFADVSNGAVRTNDDFLVFLGDLLPCVLRVLCG